MICDLLEGALEEAEGVFDLPGVSVGVDPQDLDLNEGFTVEIGDQRMVDEEVPVLWEVSRLSFLPSRGAGEKDRVFAGR